MHKIKVGIKAVIKYRADGNGPAAPVLAGPVFLKNFHFYK